MNNLKESLNTLRNEVLQIINSFRGNKESDPLSELKSAETRTKERKSLMRRRFLLVLILVPIVFLILKILIKSFNLYYAQFDQREETKAIKKPEIKLEINTFTRWQDLKDKADEELGLKVEGLNKSVNEVKENLNQGFNDINATLKENMNGFETRVLNDMEKNSNLVKAQLEEVTIQNNENIKKVEEKVDSKIDSFATKLSDIKDNVSQNGNKPSISLPDLPPINSATTTNIPLKENMFSKNIQKESVVEETVEEEVAVSSYGVTSLSTLKTPEKVIEDKKMPSFTLMPGFAKGVIVGGADVPTLTSSTTEPKPIWISVSSDQLIANNDTTNMKDCLIRATAVGEIASSRARVVLSELSCSLTDLDGNKYKIIKPVKGVVYSEDGKLGVKGRLVSKEGEIIEKGIPLAAIEGAMSMLNKTNNYILPNGTTARSQANPLADFATGGGTSGSKVLQKFSEYYLKILEELNPYIEIKAKRLVTIAFQGGEMLTPEKYETFDVDYFEKKEFDENNH